MNKSEFVHEVENLANRFAFLFKNYTDSNDGYAGKTEDGKPIIIGHISASIQNGKLATINVDIGCVDSIHRIIIGRYPDSEDPENPKNNIWSIEDK